MSMPDNLPNLLWIFCDQLRWCNLSLYGDPNIETPNLDRLAREGAVFTHAFSQCPICTPFRGGLVTGQYGHVNGVRVLGDLLSPECRTIAHVFREAGYRTSYVGKWHLASTQNVHGWNEGEDHWVHPMLRGGFEDWFGFELSNHFWKTRYCTGETFWPPLELEGYQTDALTNLSLKYLSEEAPAYGKPWFHVLSVEAPHHGRDHLGEDRTAPNVSRYPAPPEYEARVAPDTLVLRENVPEADAELARRQQAQYYAQIANLDDNVGRILAWLEESGQAANTVVAFFSDHGELGGCHGRYQKTWLFDESIRIPMLLRAPGVAAGTVIEAPFSGIDIFPTCASLCGVPVPATVQGEDFSALARGLTEHAPREAALIQWLGRARYGFGDFEYRAIRTRRYTYSVGTIPDSPGRELVNCLYDNERDPWQLDNLFGRAEYAQTQARLHELLKHEVLRSGEALPAFVK